MSVSVTAATTSTTVNLSTSDLKVHEELLAVHRVASLQAEDFTCLFDGESCSPWPGVNHYSFPI